MRVGSSACMVRAYNTAVIILAQAPRLVDSTLLGGMPPKAYYSRMSKAVVKELCNDRGIPRSKAWDELAAALNAWAKDARRDAQDKRQATPEAFASGRNRKATPEAVQLVRARLYQRHSRQSENARPRDKHSHQLVRAWLQQRESRQVESAIDNSRHHRRALYVACAPLDAFFATMRFAPMLMPSPDSVHADGAL